MTAPDPAVALAGRKIFLTGGSGFIGRRVLAALAAAGAVVTATARSRRDAEQMTDGRVTACRAGLDDPAALETALRGADVLIHLAYDVRASARSNLAAFDSLMRAARAARVDRIVHMSSIVVYDGWPDADLDETASLQRPGGSPYRRAKMEMERILMAGPFPVAILQPTIVYGPGSTLWTEQFAEALAAGAIVVPEPEGKCNGVFVEDVVQAVLRAAVVPDLGRERFIVSGPRPFAWSELLEGYAGILGRGEVVRRPCAELEAALGPAPEGEEADRVSPMAAVGGLGRLFLGRQRFEGLVRAVRRRRAAGGVLQPDRHLLTEFSATGTCDTSRAEGRLGYRPAFDLAAGLAATAADIRARFRPPEGPSA